MVPLHPQLTHIPLGLTFIIPFLIVAFAFLIKANKMNPKTWLVVVGVQLIVVVFGYVSLETGETEEHRVEKFVTKDLIHDHENAAEIFVGTSVLVLVFSVAAFFLRKELGFTVKMLIAGLSLVSCFTAYRAGKLGGELVYIHGAAQTMDEPSGLLPTPGMNTSESSGDEGNESLKADDNDYGNGDEALPEDEMLKQED